MYRLVVDTNVLISAIIAPGGFAAQVLRAWFLRRVALLMSHDLFAELEEVLARERIARLYRAAPERKDRLVRAIRLAAEWVDAPDDQALPLSCRDPKDNTELHRRSVVCPWQAGDVMRSTASIHVRLVNDAVGYLLSQRGDASSGLGGCWYARIPCHHDAAGRDWSGRVY